MVLHFGPRRDFVRSRLAGVQDMLDTEASGKEGVGHQTPMASPRNSLGAHEGDSFPSSQAKQPLDTSVEFRGLHIIGEASKARIAPRRVGRIAARVAQTTQLRQMNVADARSLQSARQRILIKLRIAS